MSACPSLETLERGGAANAAHLRECATCRSVAELMATGAGGALDDCARAELLIAAGAASPLRTEDSGFLAEHLDECDACREAADSEEEAGLVIGERFAVRGEIARGGMGVILDGIDPTIRRELVIKVLQDRLCGAADTVARFVAEAQIQGQLEHPSICPVHELGVDAEGRPFFTMKKIKGRSLQQLLDGREDEQPWRSLLEVFLKVSDAVAFAHSRGVIHRDLKPDNIMIGQFGEVLVLDWGIAKLLHHAEGDRVSSNRIEGNAAGTEWGAVLGTPNYMAPEQARGEPVDERADVYALGGVLYAILTLSPPLEGATTAEVLGKLHRGEVAPPARRAPGRRIPADLAAVAMKALAPEPGQRYQVVSELRAEVEAFLDGRTLRAARYSPVHLLRKWVARNQVFTLTAAAAVLVLFAATGVYLVKLTRAKAATERALAEELVAQGDALGPAGRWLEARQQYVAAAEVFAGVGAHGAGDSAVELGLLDTYYHAPPPIVTMEAGAGDTETVALAADGRLAVSGGRHGLSFWEVSTGRRLERVAANEAPVRSVVFSGDGRLLLSGGDDGTVRLWQAPAGRQLRALSGHGGPVRSVALSRDGRIAISGSEDMTIRLWSLDTGAELSRLPADPRLQAVALSADGRTALSNSTLTVVTVWDVEARHLFKQRRAFDQSGPINSFALTGDGELAISGLSDGSLRFVDTRTGETHLESFIHRGAVKALAVSADGRVALSGGRDGSVRLWDLPVRKERVSFSGHLGAVNAVALSGNGELALSSGVDGTLRVWNPASDATTRTLAFTRSGVSAVALSPDGRVALSGDGIGRAILWDVATAKWLRQGIKGFRVGTTVFSPDGALAAWGGGTGPGNGDTALRVWDVRSGRALPSLPTADWTMGAVFTPDGRHVMAPGAENSVRLWEVETGREVAVWKHHRRPVTTVAISPDGRLGLSGALDGRIALWELASGRTLRTWVGHPNGQVSVAFSEDSQLVLSGGEDTFVRLWSVATGEEVRRLRGHTGNAVWVAAVPGGKLAASAGWDGTMRLWELATGRQLHAFDTLGGHRSSMLALSRDGHLALVATKGPRQGAIGLFDFSLAAQYRDFDTRVAAAQATLQRDPADPQALAVLGHWYAFRGVWTWAAELLEKARAAGVIVSPLELGRVFWKKGDLGRARTELAAALARAEAPAWYLRLCLAAIEEERRRPTAWPPIPGPAGSKVAVLDVMDLEGAADWSVQRNLQPGDRAYGNKSTTIDSVDPRLRGLDWIKPAEIAKSSSANPLVRLTLRQDAELYVAADIIEAPPWLQSWESTDLDVVLRGHPHRVYKKRFPAGPVELGPYAFLDGAMYVVVVR